ncbi:hypothetical protein D3C87_1908030 [compost metagenome]
MRLHPVQLVQSISSDVARGLEKLHREVGPLVVEASLAYTHPDRHPIQERGQFQSDPRHFSPYLTVGEDQRADALLRNGLVALLVAVHDASQSEP